MEKSLSADEKIRRAEEIYYRRKMQLGDRESACVNVSYERKNFGLLKKIFLQMAICLVIYVIIYLVQTTNYVFSGDVISKTKEIINYDIDIGYWSTYINELFNKNKEEQDENIVEEPKEENQETFESENHENIENTTVEENIGGENVIVDTENLSEAEADVKYILSSKSLIVPLNGVITSRFGPRESANPRVSKYHTGIDIAVNEGTQFIASMGGTVSLVSSEGNYGVHLKIVNGDVENLYAHCKNIYVKEGDEIKQGQVLGETGATGNVTGPHLHFEIIREGRYVNPDDILKF